MCSSLGQTCAAGSHREAPMAYRGSLSAPRGAKPINEGDPNNFLSKAHKSFNVSNLRHKARVSELFLIHCECFLI